MNVALFRRIDYWIGIPLCLLFTLYEKIKRRFFPKSVKNLGKNSNALFIQLSEMGAVILAHTALTEMQRAHPGVRIHFLTFRSNRACIDLLGTVPADQVFTIDDSSTAGFIASTLGVIWKTRRRGMDVAFDLELFARASCLLAYLCGARQRSGFHSYRMEGLYRGNLLTHHVLYNPYQHMTANFVALVGALAAPADELPLLKKRIAAEPRVPGLALAASEQQQLTRRLKALQPAFDPARPLVVMNPNAGALAIRAWPLKRYTALASELVARRRATIVVMGLEEARPDAQAILEAVPQNGIDITGRTTLKEVITLFSMADVLVTNDSGPAHFAALTPIHNFVFFGPETPRLYGPLGPHAHPLYADFSCSPCLTAYNHRNSPCSEPQCLHAISVESVLKQILKTLDHDPRDPSPRSIGRGNRSENSS